MRVLTICKGHKNIAGAQLYLKQISSLFSEKDHELHFAFHYNDGIRVFKEIGENCNVNLWEYDWRHLSFKESIGVGMRLCRKLRPDLIIFNSSNDKILAPIWAAWLARIRRCVMIVHCSESSNSLPLFRKKVNISFPIPSRYSFKKRFLRGFTFRLLSRILFVNNMTRKSYLSLYRVSKKKRFTIYNGVDMTRFLILREERLSVRNSLGINSHEILILAMGNLTEVKGYSYLFKAIHQLRQKGIDVNCIVAGEGELKEKLEDQISCLSLKGHARLLGYRDDIPLLLAASDIYCMPSLSEGLPYGLLEAIASGTPVIASNVGGIPEVIKNGHEGLLVPPKNVQKLTEAIEMLVKDENLRRRMGQAGKEVAQKRFSLERMLDLTRGFFMRELHVPL